MSFDFQAVFLWTDRLIYLLLFLVIGLIFYISRHEHLLAPWRQIRQRPLAMSALVVLLFYIGIGLLDSVHFRKPLPTTDAGQEIQYDPEVLSLLDVILSPLKNNVERTYSAPLATQAFSKEMIEAADGSQHRVYPRLKFGGAHLESPETERSSDILSIVSKRLVSGVFIWGLISMLFVLILAQRHQKSAKEMAGEIWRGEAQTAWRAILFTAAFSDCGCACAPEHTVSSLWHG